MDFVGTGVNLAKLIGLFATTIRNIFTSLDNVQFMDTPFSLMDIWIAIILLEIIFWYIIKVITTKDWDSSSGSFESPQANYSQYVESYESSSSNINYDEEILHE